jgi:cytochrome c peroxidase
MNERTGSRWTAIIAAHMATLAAAIWWAQSPPRAAAPDGKALDRQLAVVLERAGFTGRVESSLEGRLGRRLDRELAELGRLLFFDNINGLHQDNSCAGCHAPASGFGDTGSMAIGVDSNRIAGPGREGPRNQRRAPTVANSAFYPKLMLNARFVALSGDPFDNSAGFLFPAPEGMTRFPANDPGVPTLLAAQGHIPQTELVEMAGFTGTAGTINSNLDQFDNGQGHPLPPADESGFRNEPIRRTVLGLINETPAYRKAFDRVFSRNGQILEAGEITFAMVGLALAEFQTSLMFADAPIDRFARGHRQAMKDSEKRGAMLFFGKAGCVNCHAVAGRANEMFSDFENHAIGVPQIIPVFGIGSGNVMFDGPGQDEDFGAEQVSGNAEDRYKFRTSPLRNIALQPAFFHNGAYTRLEDAIRLHLDPRSFTLGYDPVRAGVDADLTLRVGPQEPLLERLDPGIAEPTILSEAEFSDLVSFLRDGLLDLRARPDQLCKLIPREVPSGLPVLTFEGCRSR